MAEILTRNTNTYSLNLSENQITNQGVKFLIRGLAYNKTLKVLNLTANKLTVKSLDLFMELFKWNSTLDHVILTQNKMNKITEKSKIMACQQMGVKVDV